MATADEADVLEALVASERVEEWLDAIRQSASHARQRSALAQLERWVTERDSYAEEARKAGAVRILTQLLKKLGEDEQAKAARVIAACSGPAAAPSQTRVLRYGEGVAVAVCEGFLGDGLGARVWLAAQALARTLVAAPQLVTGQRVLEVGAGVGLIGLLAARLGASQVTMTDNDAVVLRQLRRSVEATLALHGSKAQPGSAAQQKQQYDAAGHGTPATAAACTASRTDGGPPAAAAGAADANGSASAVVAGAATEADANSDAAWDPEDADSCDDLDDFLAASDGGHLHNAGGSSSWHGSPADGGSAWDWDGLAVRSLEWCDALPAATTAATADGEATGSTADADAAGSSGAGAGAAARQPSADVPPQLPDSAQFQVVLGSDVVYEAPQAEALAATLQRRLAAGGRALLCCPIRDQAIFETFEEQLALQGLAFWSQTVVPLPCDAGIADQARGYEGGFRLLALQHGKAAAAGGGCDEWPWDAMLSWQEP